MSSRNFWYEWWDGLSWQSRSIVRNRYGVCCFSGPLSLGGERRCGISIFGDGWSHGNGGSRGWNCAWNRSWEKEIGLNVPETFILIVKQKRKDITTVDDPFNPLTYNIPEKLVTFIEGASYSVVIFAGFGIAAAAGYAVCKELIFEPKEYKIYGKALERVQNDSQVRVRIGTPVTGYGQESRNRAVRQRIPHKTWKDEDGVEINFYIRGPHGAGKVFTGMFQDKVDKKWKFTYLIVEINLPRPVQLMLGSYVPP
ncbi:hypothetical protein GIB67_003299 [Kingdonia uniflora]|uniref:Mitochondrial import inner membrane translocase subunit Tim21 n=1 Tax=Kingdonia uniflora TaxID=39325 RepID=A0A7J7P8L8_9MAGN|nr:hypothetical protein GIB67_003299 [Kingdonia uniflora]